MTILTYNLSDLEIDLIADILFSSSSSTLEEKISYVGTSFFRAESSLGFLSRSIRSFAHSSDNDGVFHIKNLPREVDSDLLVLFFGMIFGEVKKYEGEGDYLMRVQRRPGADLARPSSSNSLEFLPHTDLTYVPHPPDYLLMHGTKVDQDVMHRSTFCSLRRLIGELDKNVIDVLEQDLFKFSPAAHYSGGQVGTSRILNRCSDGNFNIRYRSDSISALREDGRAALDELKRVISRSTIAVPLSQSDLYIISNKRTLHGRTASSSGAIRILNRGYVICKI